VKLHFCTEARSVAEVETGSIPRVHCGLPLSAFNALIAAKVSTTADKIEIEFEIKRLPGPLLCSEALARR
jgi:hypothetical protein